MEALESSLPIDVDRRARRDLEPPNNVGQAGQSGIAVGAITPDRNDAGGRAGSGSSPTICGWPRRTRWRWRGSWYETVAAVASLAGCSLPSRLRLSRRRARRPAAEDDQDHRRPGLRQRDRRATSWPVLLTADVTREFISRTHYAIVADPNQADAVLTGALVNFVSLPDDLRPDLGPRHRRAGDRRRCK